MFGKLRNVGTALAVAALAMVSGVAGATSIYDPLTSAVSFTDVNTVIIAIAALIAAVLVVIWGVRKILSMLKRG